MSIAQNALVMAQVFPFPPWRQLIYDRHNLVGAQSISWDLYDLQVTAFGGGGLLIMDRVGPVASGTTTHEIDIQLPYPNSANSDRAMKRRPTVVAIGADPSGRTSGNAFAIVGAYDQAIGSLHDLSIELWDPGFLDGPKFIHTKELNGAPLGVQSLIGPAQVDGLLYFALMDAQDRVTIWKTNTDLSSDAVEGQAVQVAGPSGDFIVNPGAPNATFPSGADTILVTGTHVAVLQNPGHGNVYASGWVFDLAGGQSSRTVSGDAPVGVSPVGESVNTPLGQWVAAAEEGRYAGGGLTYTLGLGDDIVFTQTHTVGGIHHGNGVVATSSNATSILVKDHALDGTVVVDGQTPNLPAGRLSLFIPKQ